MVGLIPSKSADGWVLRRPGEEPGVPYGAARTQAVHWEPGQYGHR
ncbi:hypothetical protein ACFWB1_35525 [Streptomyces goshikiensis]